MRIPPMKIQKIKYGAVLQAIHYIPEGTSHDQTVQGDTGSSAILVGAYHKKQHCYSHKGAKQPKGLYMIKEPKTDALVPHMHKGAVGSQYDYLPSVLYQSLDPGFCLLIRPENACRYGKKQEISR
jgi:hypothetical protein